MKELFIYTGVYVYIETVFGKRKLTIIFNCKCDVFITPSQSLLVNNKSTSIA